MCSLGAYATSSGCSWKPSPAQIKQLERFLKLPEGRPLSSYSRFYSGQISAGQHIIVGEFLKAESAKVQIVDEQKMPKVLDGGCSVVHLKYNVEKKRVLQLTCNGVG